MISKLTVSISAIFLASFAVFWPCSIAFAVDTSPITYAEAKATLEREADIFLRNKRVDLENMRARVHAFEARWVPTLTYAQVEEFQRLVGRMGLDVKGEIVQALPSTSFWALNPTYLETHNNAKPLPYEVDYFGVGAGLAGAGAMPVMHEFCKRTGCSLAWGDAQGVGRGASSLNGGNFADWSERFTGMTAEMKPIEGQTEGLYLERYKFYKFTHADWSEEQLRYMAHESALQQMRNGIANARLLQKTASEKNIEAYISDSGWFR